MKQAEWAAVEKTQFGSREEGREILSEIGRDVDVRTLVEEIRALERGEFSGKTLVRRDLVTFNFCQPMRTPQSVVADHFRFTDEYQIESDNRIVQHCRRRDDFSRFVDDCARFKSSMR